MRLTILGATLFVACGAEPAAPSRSAAPTSVVTPSAEHAAPPPRADAEPTVLTEAQRAADKLLEPSAATALDAFWNWPAALSKDNRRLLFLSNRDGSPQLYLGDVTKKSAAPLALTKGPDRVDEWAYFTPDGKGVLFRRDHEGDELYHVYRVGLDGAGLTDLTPNGKYNREPFLVPQKKSDLIVYLQHPVVDPSSELVVQNIGGGEPKVVYKDPGVAALIGVSADGVHALLQHAASVSNSWLDVVDTTTGKAKRLYPPEGTVEAVSQGDMAPDGKFAFVATDGGAERALLHRVEVATGKVVATYEETNPRTAAMGGVFASPSGDRVAVQIDTGTHLEIRVLDGKTLTLQLAPKTPLGLIVLASYPSDGKSLLVRQSLSDTPGDAYLLDLATGAITKLRDDPRPALDALERIEASVVRIPAFDGLTIPMNVTLPKGAPTQRRPTIVSIHGGPASGSLIHYDAVARFYLSQGFAFVEPNLRGSVGFGRAYEMADNKEKRGDVLKDLERVNAWVKQQPWCDPDRVVVHGASYGGYVTLLALTRQPKLWRAGIDLVGIADLPTMLRTTGAGIRAIYVDEFGDLEKDAALLREWSPLEDVDKIVVPLFVYASQNDSRVPRSQSDMIVTAARARGLPVEYMVAPNEGHTPSARSVQIEILTRTTRFLKEAMR